MGPFATGPAARTLRVVLAINAIFNLAGSVILFAVPRTMMGVFGVHLDGSSLFICYLLGAASLGLATVSGLAAMRPYPAALATAASPSVVFHAATAIIGLILVSQGFAPAVWGNIAVHTALAAAITVATLRFRKGILTASA
jgi:hypothetical protein